MEECSITIGFSSHHPETLPFALEQMERHRIIVLEEPPSPQFIPMLSGQLGIDDYLMELDSGFPEFERSLCSVLRDLHSRGRRIIQVEPYLEKLLEIHELFAVGKTPSGVLRLPSLRAVYQAEKQATEALIAYYAHSVSSPFDQVVQAVKTFARADAQRLTLREQLRAAAIASLARDHPGQTIFVEAGYIHYPLYHYLRREVGASHRVCVVFLLAPVIRKLEGKRRNLGPGDLLTLHYAFHCRLDEAAADLLAARSLIYIKLIHKEELLPSSRSPTPHAEDEIEANRMVDCLSFEDCRSIFERIRLSDRKQSQRTVRHYLNDAKKLEIHEP
jgi:hypothetical protein